MSGGTSCHCAESKKLIRERRWHVYQRFCNHSAFSGYHRTPSAWSSIGCAQCGAVWRTKADYVHTLPDFKANT